VEHEQNGSIRAEYGKAMLQNLSEQLTKEFGRGFTVTNLKYMRQFYITYPNGHALRGELTWTHYRTLLRVEDEAARNWYAEESIRSGWSSRQLERQISTLYYERLLSSRDKGPVVREAAEKTGPPEAEDFIKDPYVLEFLDLKDYPALRESDLEQALIDKLQEFLLELGRGFCFVARQKRMRYEDEDFYLDLVFYHSILKCYVLIDLKLGKLTHGDVGQMDSYIRMFDAMEKGEDDNPTIGIILCSQKNEAIVKYSVLNDAKQVFASKYRLTLPTAEELQREIETERRRIEAQKNMEG
jgi:predicted nuclease of restriction endonuclease-like (RecB) superfamily